MEETTFPPSPNWFLPNVLDVARNGTVCYGANTSVVVLNVADDIPGEQLKIDKISIIQHAHRERVSVVSIGPEGAGYEKMVATIGGDGYVKVWDTGTGLVSVMHQQHGDKAKLRGMDWSPANRQLIVSVDEGGTLVLFDVGANKTDTVTFSKLHATAIACCPHKWHWVAVGDASGLVWIVSVTGAGSVVRKMRGHDSAVSSLSWRPAPGNPFAQGGKGATELMLASGAGRQSTFVWRAGSVGRCQMEIIQPTAPPGQPKTRNTVTGATAQGSFTAVCWAGPNKLVTSTAWGELLCWDVKELAAWQHFNGKTAFQPQQKNQGRKALPQTHQRAVFSVACVKPSLDRADAKAVSWRTEDTTVGDERLLAWTTSQDRQLVATDLESCATRLALPTLGGFVYCIAVSVLDCHKVAVGAGDGTIRVWDMTTPKTIDLRSVWLKIKGRVTALAWHASRDTLLAYGTSEGRVGVYDMKASANGPTHMWAFHKATVYGLGWGPVASKRGGRVRTSSQKHFLYSCGDKMLLCYDLQHSDETFEQVRTCCYRNKEPLELDVTEFAWKPDYSVVAIGTATGCVYLCTAPYLDVVTVVYPMKKQIQSLAWHPMTTTTEPGGTRLSNLLAFASTENVVKIYDLELFFSARKMDADDKNVLSDAVEAASCTTLTGHTERVSSVAWSPHVAGTLVSASYDGSAQVWDLRGGSVTLVAVYVGHSGWLACVAWCPNHSDFIITGASDFTLRVWRVSTKNTERRSKPLNVLPPPLTDVPGRGKDAVGRAKDPVGRTKDGVGCATKDLIAHCIRPPKPEVQVPGKSGAAVAGLAKKSYFPISSRSRNLGKDSILASIGALLQGQGTVGSEKGAGDGELFGVGDLAHLGFFSDDAAMDRMLSLEGEHLRKMNLPSYAQNLDVWRQNDLAAMLEKAIVEKKVTLWHMAISPMASARLWQDLARTYVEQLRDENRLQDAASMLVVMDKAEEAVEMLTADGLFREAVCVSRRCRGANADELRRQVLAEWARHAELGGDYELATQCYISVGDFDRAARSQGHRKDAKSLGLAVLLAARAGNAILVVKIGEQAIHKHLTERNHAQALALATDHASLELWIWLIVTHQELTNRVEATEPAAFRDVDDWFARPDRSTAARRIVERCRDKFSLTESADALTILSGIDCNPRTKHEVLLQVAAYIAVSLSVDSERLKPVYLVKALDASYRHLILSPRSRLLLAVITLSLPSPDTVDRQPPSGADLSVDAFLCAGLVHFLNRDCWRGETGIEDDDGKTSALLPRVIAAMKQLLPSTLDETAMFYYNTLFQYSKFEDFILKHHSPQAEEGRAKDNEAGKTVSDENHSCDVGKGKAKDDGIAKAVFNGNDGLRDVVEGKRSVDKVLKDNGNGLGDTEEGKAEDEVLKANGDVLDDVDVENAYANSVRKLYLTVSGSAEVPSPAQRFQCPLGTLKRLRNFEAYFQTTRVAAPNPFLFHLNVENVLAKYVDLPGVQSLLQNVGIAWKNREEAVKKLWVRVWCEPGEIFDEDDNVKADFWVAVEQRNQETVF